MSARYTKQYECTVVNETIKISLQKKYSITPGSRGTLYVKCSQEECQYVDENIPPCPLTLAIFAEEILIMEKSRQQKSELDENY